MKVNPKLLNLNNRETNIEKKKKSTPFEACRIASSVILNRIINQKDIMSVSECVDPKIHKQKLMELREEI